MAVSRRTFMRLASAGLSTALVPLWGCAQQVGQARPTSYRPTPAAPLTPRDLWYYMSVQDAIESDLESYRLKLGGKVNRKLKLTIADLQARFPIVEDEITVTCVGNTPGGGLLSAARFRGVRVADVLEEAGVGRHATSVVMKGLDGFVSYQSLEVLQAPEAMLAFEMGVDAGDLRPLPIDHGFPLRILTPGHFGYMMPKWIDSITFVDTPEHEVLRRSIDYVHGRIKIASGFSNPRPGTIVPSGRVEVLGYAMGDGREIAQVDVRIDDGPWQAAEIVWNDRADGRPPYLWSLWRYEWDAPVGTHELTSRATYADGESQTVGRDFPYSSGSLYTMRVDVT